MKYLIALLLATTTQAAAEWPIKCKPLPERGRALVDNPFRAVERAHWAWHAVFRQASWRAVYSPGNVARFEPYSASLDAGVWHVVGKPPLQSAGLGAPEAYVCASDGHALAMGRDD